MHRNGFSDSAMRPRNIRLLVLGLALVALAVTIRTARPVAPAGPNVLLIVVDTLRADHLGAYGYDRPTSPHLDALASRGARFARAYAPSSWTGASVASILTGLYPRVHGMERHTSDLGARWPRLPAAFQDAGYATGAISANPAFVTPEVGFGGGFESFDLLHGAPANPGDVGDHIWANPDMTALVHVAAANKVTDAALAWIRRHHNESYFLYLHYFDPHAGYYPPPEYARKLGVDPTSPLAGRQQRTVMFAGRPPADPATLATLIGLYDGEIAFTDAEIGRLLTEVAPLITRPTIVVVTADHGEEFGEHGGLQHGKTLFEEQIRVPLVIARLGGDEAAAEVIETPFSLCDLWPLLAGMTGVPTRPGSAALALADLAGTPASSPVFADLATVGRLHRWATVAEHQKLIVTRERTSLLFDLQRDPREQVNRASAEPAHVRRLRRALMRQRASWVAERRGATPAPAVSWSQERLERLRALGYAE